MRKPSNSVSQYDGRGVWVPAFAGTTTSFWARARHTIFLPAASREEGSNGSTGMIVDVLDRHDPRQFGLNGRMNRCFNVCRTGPNP